jgi:hypothetical protein
MLVPGYREEVLNSEEQAAKRNQERENELMRLQIERLEHERIQAAKLGEEGRQMEIKEARERKCQARKARPPLTPGVEEKRKQRIRDKFHKK